MNRDKIKSQEEIVKIVKSLKKKNKKIVTCNGSFDILHFGHIKSLWEAKAQGDFSIVLLNSDKSIKIYKGPQRPINSQRSRAKILAALECVDFITIFNEITPVNLLAKIKPDIYCQGKDWGRSCIERQIVEEYGGKIHILKWQKGLSTTKSIKRILKVHQKSSPKAVFLDRDGTININEPEYTYKIEDFKFTPHAISALQQLSRTDSKIIIITNQSGIGRGYFKEKDVKKLHQWLFKEFKKKRIRIDKIYYCPHRPQDKCSYRKPEIGMLLKAVKDFGISLDGSWLVGDDVKDIIMGKRANLKTIKLGNRMPKKLKLEPDYYVKNLLEAVKIIKSYPRG